SRIAARPDGRTSPRNQIDFWSPLMGLGIPQPFVPTFVFHPLAPLLTITSPATWARIFLSVHVAWGAAGMWVLLGRLGVSRLSRSVAVATFLLASPVQNYALVQFWPSHLIVWTTAPWLLVAAWRLLDAERAERTRRAIILGLLAGLVLANTNPGHVIVYIVLVAAVAAGRWRQVWARAGALAIAGGIALAVAAPMLAQLWHERPYFAPDLGLANVREPIPWWGVLTLLLAPLGTSDEELRLPRLLFFGGPFALLALAGCIHYWRTHRDLVLTVALGCLAVFTSIGPQSIVSARYQFRDPVTLAAIPLAALALDRLVATRRGTAVAVPALVIQLTVLCFAIAPAASRAWVPDARAVEWFRGATAATEAADILAGLITTPDRVGSAEASPDRHVVSPFIDDESYEGRLLMEGLGVNALAYRGIPLVNGWFKAVSTGTVSPDERMFYGRVQVPQPLLESAGTLDVLGIRYVLALPEDTVADGLAPRGTMPRKLGGQFVLYENPDAWPAAFLAAPSIEQATPAAFADCPHDRLLCRDLTPLVNQRLPEAIRVTRDGSALDVRMLPTAGPRIVVVTQMYRPDWVARAGNGDALETLPIAGALTGVRVPPGVTTLTLRYRPWPVIAGWTLAAATLVAGVALLLVQRRAGAASR
ncbi:MAG: hypothetical protein AB7P99_21400, partial [Vicinamibacterales bacterium]